MEEAISEAFREGDFEGVFERLSVLSMNATCKEERTPLMAACKHGNKPVVNLLMDLLCDERARDKDGKTAMDFANEAGHTDLTESIARHRLPPIDSSGKAVFTWDTCSHPPECKYLDTTIGWLICTGCGLVLQENALQLAGDEGANGFKQIATVRGADAEYNAWRADELDLADAMAKLGVVDNDAAKRHGEQTSIWAARSMALMWLDKRRRIKATWEHHAKLARLQNQPLPAKKDIPAYARGAALMEIQGGTSAETTSSTTKPWQSARFRGAPPKPEVPVEEEELIDPAEIVAQKFASKPTKWRIAIDRWDTVGRAALHRDLGCGQVALLKELGMVLPLRLKELGEKLEVEVEVEEEEEEGEEEKVEMEKEIEWEM